MKKKQLSKLQNIFIFALITALHCVAIIGVYLLAEGGFSIGTVAFTYDVPELLCFAPLVLPLFADIILRCTTDIKPYVTLISAITTVIISFVFYIINPNMSADVVFYGENYIFFLLALISFAVRCAYSIVDFILLKQYKQIILGVLLAVIGVASFFGGYMLEDDINKFIANRGIGVADKTGSWGAINQDVERGENWQQIVTDSPFKLGEISSVTNVYGYAENHCDKNTYPNINGSTVCVPMAVEFARQHLGFEDKVANDFVDFLTTHYAYKALIKQDNESEHYIYNLGTYVNVGSVDLVIATEPSDEELALADNWGIELKKTPVCYDAFVFITHKNNPVDSLTVEQIKKIYSGEITNWKDVGGKNEKIRAFQREKNSGSQTAMENLVMGGADMIDPIEVKVIEGMGMLVDAVAEYENETASLGYTYRYYIDTLYKNDNIKTIAVDGVAPTDENIRSRAYPFTTNYYGVIREGDEEEIGGQFLNWMLSDEGQKCIAQAGYITLS